MTHLIPAAVACLVSRRVLGWALPSRPPELPREVAEDLTGSTWRSSTSMLCEVIYGYDVAADFARLAGRVPLLYLHGDHDESASRGRMMERASTPTPGARCGRGRGRARSRAAALGSGVGAGADDVGAAGRRVRVATAVSSRCGPARAAKTRNAAAEHDRAATRRPASTDLRRSVVSCRHFDACGTVS